jgi:RHS repeat-associated protein
MEMPGRKFGTMSRYGFNGKEQDPEVKGEGNSYDFGARIYDPRISRWLSVEPLQKKYAYLSPDVFCENNPIFFIDPDGREVKPTKEFLASKYGAIYNNLLKNDVYKSILGDYWTSKRKNYTLEPRSP